MVPLLERRKGASGEQFYGAAYWDSLAPKQKRLYDYLCGNHSRNLPIDAFNRLFESWLADELGDHFAAASLVAGPTARLEKSGLSLLRSMVKLMHNGYGAYAKGDGPQVKAWMEANAYAWHPRKSIGRVEQSKRQDWCLELSEKLYPMVKPVCLYAIDTLVLEPNVLRDSVLMRLEIHDFEAYIHTCAIMWLVCFRELRSLTNNKTFELNPLELARVYDKLWEVGTLLQTGDALTILESGYRPWPKQRPECPEATKMYAKLEKGLPERVGRLRIPHDRKDAVPYRRVLLSIMKLFGKAIHESLHRTMGNYLEATEGKYAESNLSDWEKEQASGLLCHNNPAERPFGVMKELQRLYPSMTISSLSYIAHAIVNGTFVEGGQA